MYLFYSYEGKRLMLGDFDMNSMPWDFDSLKDVFKQTILHQEIIFRNQVHELHRLFNVQKRLMKDLTPVEHEKYNPWKANTHSFSQETRITTNSIPMLELRASTSLELFEGWQGNNFKFQPRHFGQSLPDQCINLEDNDLPNKVKVRDNLNETMDVSSLHGRNFSEPLELMLSLSLGVANGKKEDKERSRYDKETNTCSGIVIDLEESTERTSDEDAKHSPFGSAAKVTYSSGKLDSQVTINSDPITSGYRNCQEWSYSDHGTGLKSKESMPYENLLTRKRQFTSRGVGCVVDLNEVHIDDSSCHSDDCIVAQPLVNSDNDDGRTEVQVRSSVSSGRKECEMSIINPASEPRPQIDMSKDRGSHSGKTMILQNGPAHGLNSACVVATQLGCENTEEGDSALSCSDKIEITIDLFPPSGKSSCISDNDSSPVRTEESGTQPLHSNLPASDQFSGNHGRSKVAETLSGEQDRRSSDSNEVKHECYNNREELAEVDNLIHVAAELLIHISSENPVWYQESSTQTASNELENEDKEQPQYSYDSYELMTLELAESAADDNSVSSKPLKVSDGLTKDFGIKLRRGRRLKDFQKDILPSLASLSRLEICEDINILEGILRSREYKKMRANMVIGESWCKPVRSRRSRRNYVGRKT